MAHEKENSKTGIREAAKNAFDGKEILKIGGTYRNKYAIIKQ